MKRKFWQFVHDCLERSWHWGYRTKLREPPQLGSSFDIRYVQVDTSLKFESKPMTTVFLVSPYPYRCDACGANWSGDKPLYAPNCPRCGSTRTVAL